MNPAVAADARAGRYRRRIAHDRQEAERYTALAAQQPKQTEAGRRLCAAYDHLAASHQAMAEKHEAILAELAGVERETDD